MERLSVDRLRADEKLVEVVKGYPCLWDTRSKTFRDLMAKENAWKVVSAEVGYSDEDCLKRWKALRDRFVREAKKVKENMSTDGAPGYVPPWSLFESMAFLVDSIRHRKSSALSLKRDATAAFPEEIELETSGADGECLSPSSPASSVELNLTSSPPVRQTRSAKRRKVPRINIPFVVAPTSSSPSDPRTKDKSTPQSNPVSQAILKSLKALEETVQEQQKIVEDEDELFGKQVAMVMRRLSSRQKAMAKLRIQQVFLDVEFPPEQQLE